MGISHSKAAKGNSPRHTSTQDFYIYRSPTRDKAAKRLSLEMQLICPRRIQVVKLPLAASLARTAPFN